MKSKTLLLDDAEVEAMGLFFSNFKDPTRLKLLYLLETKEMTASEICSNINISKSNLSHQIKLLILNKLVKQEKIGRNVKYSLNDNHVKDILEVAYKHLFIEDIK